MNPHKKSNLYFLIGFGLLNLITYSLLIASLSLALKEPLSYWQFPLAFIFSILTNYGASVSFFGKGNASVFLKTSGVLMVIVAATVLLAISFYDLSFDGQWYHQEIVYGLKTGWNPYYGEMHAAWTPSIRHLAVWCNANAGDSDTAVITGRDTIDLKLLQINHFVKGAEIPEAALYGLTNRIETSKATNGILFAASFFLSLSFLYRIDRLSTAKKVLIATLFSFNPIVITQLETFCVDGQIASLLLCLILACCFLFIASNRYYLFLLASAIILIVNVKLTAVLFSAILCAGFLFMLLMNKRIGAFKRVLAVGIVSWFAGIFLVGFHPYVSNELRYHDPLYGLAHVQRAINETTPDLYRQASSFKRLVLSLAGHTEDRNEDKMPVEAALKIPFTINKTEIANANNPQVKVAAFGPFFSGILLLSLVILVLHMLRRGERAVKRNTVVAIVSVILSVSVLAAAWWERFIPQLWLLPFMIVLVTELYPAKNVSILRSCLYVVALLNIAWALMGLVFNLLVSERIDYQMKQVKALHQTVGIQYCPYRSFKTNRVRLYENHISFQERWPAWDQSAGDKPAGNQPEGKYFYNIIHSSTIIQTASELPDLPKPLLLRLADGIR